MKPITAQPGYSASDLTDLLATKQFVYADCYTITNKDLTTLRYTTAQRKVTISTPVDPAASGPVDYTSDGAKVSGIQLQIGVGVEVDEQTMRLEFSAGMEYNGLSFASALRYGRFDGGVIRRDRYFATRWGQPWIAGIPMFVGRTSSIDKIGRSFADIKVKSDLVLLKTPMPRKVFQPSCTHTIFDPGCDLDKLDFEADGVVGSGASASVIPWSSSSSEFSAGTIWIEDADGITLVRTIDLATSSELVLSYPLEFVPQAGTHFKAYPGCIRTYARCGEFSNQANFQGFPFVPVAETAY